METKTFVFILNHYLVALDDTKIQLEKFLSYFVELADEAHGDLHQLSPMQQYKIGLDHASDDVIALFKETYDRYKQNLSKLEKMLEDGAVDGLVWSRIMGDCYETKSRFFNIFGLLDDEA